MNFERITTRGIVQGYQLQVEHALFFFGTRHLAREGLRTLYPEYEFAFLKQVHGRAVVNADPAGDAPADAHVTRRATLAPVVQTADCVPVLLASKNQVAAVHAGWRGLAAGIIAQTAARFSDDPVIFAAIGPHIQRASFEIGRDVEAELRAAAPDAQAAAAWVDAGRDPTRVHFDLHALARAQLHAALTPAAQIFALTRDTMADPEFSSYRRDSTGGRQFSFVVLNS